MNSTSSDFPAGLIGPGLHSRGVLQALGCIACHLIDTEDGAFGPELTGLGARDNVRRVIRSILEPSTELTGASHCTSSLGRRKADFP